VTGRGSDGERRI